MYYIHIICIIKQNIVRLILTISVPKPRTRIAMTPNGRGIFPQTYNKKGKSCGIFPAKMYVILFFRFSNIVLPTLKKNNMLTKF